MNMLLYFTLGAFAGMLADRLLKKDAPAIVEHTQALGQGYTVTLRTSDNPSLGRVMYSVVRDGNVAIAMGYTATPEEAVVRARAAMAQDLAKIALNT